MFSSLGSDILKPLQIPEQKTRLGKQSSLLGVVYRPAILHRRPDNHHALLKATWCLGPRGGVLFEMYIAFLHNGLAPSPFPISVAHLSWVALSWLHLYSIFTTFIDMNNRTGRLLNLHVPRSLTLCINGVYIIEIAGVYPHTRWSDNRRLRSHVTDSLIPKVYTQTWLKNC
jgi:hypothetical protein